DLHLIAAGGVRGLCDGLPARGLRLSTLDAPARGGAVQLDGSVLDSHVSSPRVIVRLITISADDGKLYRGAARSPKERGLRARGQASRPAPWRHLLRRLH